ncbi:hypothetical protein QPK87_15465 [Kamptonema cortianum]|nr:hypothetical protein [Kamptonema cortianum]
MKSGAIAPSKWFLRAGTPLESAMIPMRHRDKPWFIPPRARRSRGYLNLCESV